MKPTKPKTDNRSRVLRGGAWDSYDDAWVLSSVRSAYAPANGYRDLGFRCVQRGCQQILKGVTPP